MCPMTVVVIPRGTPPRVKTRKSAVANTTSGSTRRAYTDTSNARRPLEDAERHQSTPVNATSSDSPAVSSPTSNDVTRPVRTCSSTKGLPEPLHGQPTPSCEEWVPVEAVPDHDDERQPHEHHRQHREDADDRVSAEHAHAVVPRRNRGMTAKRRTTSPRSDIAMAEPSARSPVSRN